MAKKQKEQPKENILQKLRPFILPAILFVILFILILIAYSFFISNKYYPQTLIGDTNISFLTQGQAIRKVENKFNQRLTQKLQFNEMFTIDIATSSANIDYSILGLELSKTHSGSAVELMQNQIQVLIFPNRISPKITFGSLDKQTDNIATALIKPSLDAQLIFDEITTPEGTSSARIQIKEGIPGSSLDEEKLTEEISQFLLTGKYNSSLPLKSVDPKITTKYVLKAKQVLEEILKEPIKAKFESRVWTLDAKQLLTLLDLEKGAGSILDQDQSYAYLEKIASEIDQEVQEGLFEFNPNTKRVTAFQASREGKRVNLEKTYQILNDSLNNNLKTVNLPVDIVKPKIQTADVNSLGIQELLGRGISHFAGSIPNRTYNINLTASKINGILIPPGEIFSFNKTVGDISAETGFKQAYVIKEGRTVLDDGGGVCQDSTTLFRAVLNAGLPVVKRTAHAYRVGYYEQGFPPGLDATVFHPSVDFQFKNDTAKHILIQAYIVGTTLYIDLYGTSDGRTVTMTKPIVTNQTPPPPELRQDDPTLPKGTVKQVDWAAWGATVTFSRTVKRDGETLIKETFKSSYRPWQAVYLVGTQ